MRGRTALGAGALVVAFALAGGCGIPTDDEPRPLADETPTSTPVAASAALASRRLRVPERTRVSRTRTCV